MPLLRNLAVLAAWCAVLAGGGFAIVEIPLPWLIGVLLAIAFLCYRFGFPPRFSKAGSPSLSASEGPSKETGTLDSLKRVWQRSLRGFLLSLLLGGCVAGVFSSFVYLFHVPSGGRGLSPLFIVPFLLVLYVVLFFWVSLFIQTKKGLARLIVLFVLLQVGATLVLHPSIPVPIVQVFDSFKYLVKYQSIVYADLYASWREPVLRATAQAKYESQLPEKAVHITYYSKGKRPPYRYFLEARRQPMNRDGENPYHVQKTQLYLQTNNPNVKFESREEGIYVKDSYQGTSISFSLPNYLLGAPQRGYSIGSFHDIDARLDEEGFGVRSRYAKWAGKVIHFLRG